MTKSKKQGTVSAPVPAPMPDDFDATLSLAALLVRHEVLASVEGMTKNEVAEAFVGALTDAEADAVRRFARSVGWLVETRAGVLPTATAQDLTPPPCLAMRAREDIASLDAIRRWALDVQVVGEVRDDAPQLTLVTETPVPAKPVTELAFASSDEVASCALALSDRAEALEKEAKKLVDLGRHTEAKALQREAKHIRDVLLTQLHAQRSLPFNAGETVLSAVTRVVGATVRTAVVRSIKTAVVVGEGETYEEVTEKRLADLAEFERVVGGVAEHAAAAVLPVLRDVAERAYDAGKAAREVSAEALVRDAVQQHGAQRAAA